MRTSAQMFLPVLIVLPGAIGCAHALDYRLGRSTSLERAPATGIYELYRRGVHVPVLDTVLLKHDLLGFTRDAHGTLVAVAAGEHYALPDANYRWKFEGYSGRAGPLEIDPRCLLRVLPALLVDAALGATVLAAEAGVNAALRAGDRQGLTRYQRRKTEPPPDADP